MKTERYLNRIGIAGDAPLSADFDTLVHLQHQHFLTVPFTNLYVLRDERTTLDPTSIVPRITAGGGGLCYDLNSAFAWLLLTLEYDVTLVSGRVKRDDGSFSPEYDHLTLLVGDNLVDVGFGDFARRPLSLRGDPRTDVSGTYRVFEHDETIAAQEQTDEGWTDLYRFDRVSRTPDEFTEMAEYHSPSPDSLLTGDLLVTRATEDGRVTLSGETLTMTIRGDARKQTLSDEQIRSVLNEQFGLSSQ